MADNTLTWEQALEIQDKHLKEWQTILKPEAFEKLNQWTRQRTLNLDRTQDTPYDVPRGEMLYEFVANLAIGNELDPQSLHNYLVIS